ncbi:MAG: division/cell wall cluster transcriptional repressor MraZ [Oceanobacter sp.]
MFKGMHHVNLDAKGRLAVPAKIREQLEGFDSSALVVTVDSDDRCLIVYPVSAWAEIEEKVQGLSSFIPHAKRLKRTLLGYATEVDIDGSGRIMVNAAARDYAGLTKECVLMGQGNKLEIWDKARWNGELEEYLDNPLSPEEMPEELRNLVL